MHCVSEPTSISVRQLATGNPACVTTFVSIYIRASYQSLTHVYLPTYTNGQCTNVHGQKLVVKGVWWKTVMDKMSDAF